MESVRKRFGKRERARYGTSDDFYGVKHLNDAEQKVYDTEKAGETGFRHSGSYHRFYQGYTEVRIEKPKGGFKIARYYTAPWMRQKRTHGMRILWKIIMASLFILEIAAYLAALSLKVGSNYCAYVAAPGLVSLILIILQAHMVLEYATAKEDMEIYKYQCCHNRLPLRSFLCGAGIGLTAAASTVYMLTEGSVSAPQMKAVLLLAAACAASVIMGAAEKKTVYCEIPNTTTYEGEGHEIW